MRGKLPTIGIFLAGVAAYAPQLRPGWAPARVGDVANYVVPYYRYLAQAWGQGRWPPLWNPDVFMGVPFLANIQAAALYPPLLLLAVMPVVPALAWLQALHVGVAGAGMFTYGRRAARLGSSGAAVAAVLYMLGPYMTGQLARTDYFDALAWAPWLMVAVARGAARPRLWLAAATAALVALVVLAGHPQAAYFSFVLAIAAAAGPLTRRARQGGLRALVEGVAMSALGLALGLGLAAAQLVPTGELVAQSLRSGGVDPVLAADSPLLARGLLGSVLPQYSVPLSPEITGAGLGAAALVLAALAVVTRPRRPFVWGWLLVGLLCLWAATGHSGRLYDALYSLVPGLGLFRVPARLLIFTTVALALLAGLGTRSAVALTRARRPGPAVLATAIALAPVALVAMHVALGSPDARILRLLPRSPPPAGDMMLAATFMLLVPAACFVAMAAPGLRRGLPVVLLALVAADTWLATEPIYSRHPAPATAYDVSGGARSLLVPGPQARYLTLVASDAGLQPNQGLAQSWLSADGYDGGVLPLQRFLDFRRPLLPADSTNRPDYIVPYLTERIYDEDRLLETGSAAVVAAAGHDPNPPGCACLTRTGTADGVDVWQPSTPLGRAWLETGSARVPERVVSDTGERVEVELGSGQAGRLVLADADYSGWRATVDGRAVGIQRYKGFLRAVDVPAGGRRVIFTFEPVSFRLGLAISLTSLLITVGLALAGTRRRLRGAAGNRPRDLGLRWSSS